MNRTHQIIVFKSSNLTSAGNGFFIPYMEESVELKVGIEDCIFNPKTNPNSFEKWGTNPDVVIIINLIHDSRAHVEIDEVGTRSWIIMLVHKTELVPRLCVSFFCKGMSNFCGVRTPRPSTHSQIFL